MSIWEVAIKNKQGRQDFRIDPRVLRRELLAQGYTELPITGKHTSIIDLLPLIHKDPFDRLLVAQAKIESLRLITTDAQLAKYPCMVQKI